MMKTFSVASFLVVVALISCASDVSVRETPTAQEPSKILLFIRDGSTHLEFMLTNEVGVMKDTLEQSGFEVEIATAVGEPITAESVSLAPDLRMDEVAVAQYAGVIMPCMAADDKPGTPINEVAVAVVKKAVIAGKPVAAQLGAVTILAKAGVIKGKKYAAYEDWDVSDHPHFEGSIHSGMGIVKDGNILTSGLCPWMAREQGLEDGTKELTLALASAID